MARGDEFRELLAGLGLDDDQIVARERGVAALEAHLAGLADPVTLEACTADHVAGWVASVIDDGANDWGTLVGVYLYAGVIHNDELQVAMLDRLDGVEILENLHRYTGEHLGEDLRDRIFDGVERPPLGSTPLERTRVNAVVLPRLEAAADPATVRRILRSGLRNLPDEYFLDAKERFEQLGDIDAYLEDRGRRRIEELEQHRDAGTLYYNQRIDDAVIDFVRATPEIGRGVRHGTTVVETKIPHQAIAYLAATDPTRKQYHACHCPVVKESMAHDDVEISDTFCEFCPVFHARPWEVIFGRALEYEVLESAKRGSDRCTFAIHLPSDRIV